ncbi:Nucleolar protein 13 [Maublancomyces gigas]|uniref:Nucleolar protein 13 n=1 Tax=Discina gigas TaxID=1032678 RepID=A0ABR3G945_9PEZI
MAHSRKVIVPKTADKAAKDAKDADVEHTEVAIAKDEPMPDADHEKKKKRKEKVKRVRLRRRGEGQEQQHAVAVAVNAMAAATVTDSVPAATVADTVADTVAGSDPADAESNPADAESNPADAETPSKKRKRDLATDEIEINVDLPEPPSKKALRKLKKNPSLVTAAAAAATSNKPKSTSDDKPEEFPKHASQSRSKWGIWIGNLGYSTTSLQLEELLTKAPSKIQRTEITRVNLPADPRTKQNKGFAYIDFASEEALDYALTLTETLLYGRRVLIKDAKDFTNRHAGNPGDAPKLGPNLSSKPPSKILFVGNLDFDTKDEDLMTHFAFAGNIVKVRLATFQDSGKCRGFGFIDFEDIESTKRALLGLTEDEELTRNLLEGKEEKELAECQKKRRFIGPRQLKMEFGEDPSVRYKKRFGKDRPEGEAEGESEPPRKKRAPKKDEDWAEKAWEKKREKMDKRSKDPGAAYSNDVRRTGAITESKGKKMKFDDA